MIQQIKEPLPGQKLTVRVRKVRPEGVYVNLPDGGTGTVSPRCWGNGIKRTEALAGIRVGTPLDVAVRSWNPRTRSAALVLRGFEALPPKAYSIHSHKPEYRPLPQGTVFLLDASNVLGYLGPAHAAYILSSMTDELAAQGYPSIHFIEFRCFDWLRHNQTSGVEVNELEKFMIRDDVVLIHGSKDEADAHILQYAEVLPNSVIISKDHFLDYAMAHPAIVQTDRVREFEFTDRLGKRFVSINGLKRALVITPCDEELETTDQKVLAEPPSELKPCTHGGLIAVADEYVRRGDVRNAERVYADVGKKDPTAYDALAEMYREGLGGLADLKKAAHYDRLAYKSRKSRRESEMRARRLRAEAIRGGGQPAGHCSWKHRQELRIAAFKEVQQTIRDYFAGTDVGEKFAASTATCLRKRGWKVRVA